MNRPDLAGRAGLPELHYGSEGWGSSPSERAQVKGLFPERKGLFANVVANSAVLAGAHYGTGEDVGGFGELIADDVRVHARCDRRVGVTEPGGDHVHGDASLISDAAECLRS